MSARTLPKTNDRDPSEWQQGRLVEVAITDLSDTGDGVGRWEERVVFVPDTVPGDRAIVRLLNVKPNYAHGKLYELLEESTHRIRASCIVADKCGGCQWQHIAYEHQLEAKQNQVIQALERVGGFNCPPVAPSSESSLSFGLSQQSHLSIGRISYRSSASWLLPESKPSAN